MVKTFPTLVKLPEINLNEESVECDVPADHSCWCYCVSLAALLPHIDDESDDGFIRICQQLFGQEGEKNYQYIKQQLQQYDGTKEFFHAKERKQLNQLITIVVRRQLAEKIQARYDEDEEFKGTIDAVDVVKSKGLSAYLDKIRSPEIFLGHIETSVCVLCLNRHMIGFQFHHDSGKLQRVISENGEGLYPSIVLVHTWASFPVEQGIRRNHYHVILPKKWIKKLNIDIDERAVNGVNEPSVLVSQSVPEGDGRLTLREKSKPQASLEEYPFGIPTKPFFNLPSPEITAQAAISLLCKNDINTLSTLIDAFNKSAIDSRKKKTLRHIIYAFMREFAYSANAAHLDQSLVQDYIQFIDCEDDDIRWNILDYLSQLFAATPQMDTHLGYGLVYGLSRLPKRFKENNPHFLITMANLLMTSFDKLQNTSLDSLPEISVLSDVILASARAIYHSEVRELNQKTKDRLYRSVKAKVRKPFWDALKQNRLHSSKDFNYVAFFKMDWAAQAIVRIQSNRGKLTEVAIRISRLFSATLRVLEAEKIACESITKKELPTVDILDKLKNIGKDIEKTIGFKDLKWQWFIALEWLDKALTEGILSRKLTYRHFEEIIEEFIAAFKKKQDDITYLWGGKQEHVIFGLVLQLQRFVLNIGYYQGGNFDNDPCEPSRVKVFSTHKLIELFKDEEIGWSKGSTFSIHIRREIVKTLILLRSQEEKNSMEDEDKVIDGLVCGLVEKCRDQKQTEQRRVLAEFGILEAEKPFMEKLKKTLTRAKPRIQPVLNIPVKLPYPSLDFTRPSGILFTLGYGQLRIRAMPDQLDRIYEEIIAAITSKIGKLSDKIQETFRQLCDQNKQKGKIYGDPPGLIYKDSYMPRENLRRRLISKISQSRGCDNAGSVVVLCGMPGVGKTTELIHYFYCINHEYEKRVWLNASSITELRSSYVKLFNQLIHDNAIKPRSDDYTEDEKISSVRHWLRGTKDVLVVVDNADKHIDEIRRLLAFPMGAGCVLVSSRNQSDWEGVIDVNVLEPDEAVSWLAALSGYEIKEDTEKESAQKLVKKMGYSPMAIARIATRMKESQGYCDSPSKMLQEYDVILQAMCAIKTNTGEKENIEQYRNVAAATWELSLVAIEEEAERDSCLHYARPIIIVLSCLHHQDISRNLIRRYLLEILEVEEAKLGYTIDINLTKLIKYGLLKPCKGDRQYYSLHPFEQQVIWVAHQFFWTKRRNETCPVEDEKLDKTRLTLALSKLLTEELRASSEDPEAFEETTSLLLHAGQVYKKLAEISGGNGALEIREQQFSLAAVLYKTYKKRTNLEQAVYYGQKIYQIVNERDVDDLPDKVELLIDIAKDSINLAREAYKKGHEQLIINAIATLELPLRYDSLSDTRVQYDINMCIIYGLYGLSRVYRFQEEARPPEGEDSRTTIVRASNCCQKLPDVKQLSDDSKLRIRIRTTYGFVYQEEYELTRNDDARKKARSCLEEALAIAKTLYESAARNGDKEALRALSICYCNLGQFYHYIDHDLEKSIPNLKKAKKLAVGDSQAPCLVSITAIENIMEGFKASGELQLLKEAVDFLKQQKELAEDKLGADSSITQKLAQHHTKYSETYRRACSATSSIASAPLYALHHQFSNANKSEPSALQERVSSSSRRASNSTVSTLVSTSDIISTSQSKIEKQEEDVKNKTTTECCCCIL